jgi:hypothetical protein
MLGLTGCPDSPYPNGRVTCWVFAANSFWSECLSLGEGSIPTLASILNRFCGKGFAS